MALEHAKSGDPIDIRPLGAALPVSSSRALFRNDEVEVIREVLPAGRTVPCHTFPGPLTIQCLEGSAEIDLEDGPQRLQAGELLCLDGRRPYALRGMDEASLLMTFVRRPPAVG